MLFPEEEAPLLKKWIVKRLENTYVQPKELLTLQGALLLMDHLL